MQEKKTSKKVAIMILVATFAILSAFYCKVKQHIVIIPSVAEIITDDDFILMTDGCLSTADMSIIVKSDVELGLIDMPSTKVVWGIYECPAIYDIEEFKYEISYTSTNESIFRVDIGEDGLVSLLPGNTGKAELLISSGEIAKSVNIVVKQYVYTEVMPETIEVVKERSIMVIDETGEYEVLNSDFTIENSDIAIISDNGILTGISQGNTILKTISGAREFITEVTVLQPLLDIQVSDKSVYVGNAVKANVQLTPNTANYGTNLSYESSDTKIANVNESGTITGIKAGNVIVTVTSEEGIRKSFNVTVTSRPVVQQQSSSTGASESYGNNTTGNSQSETITTVNKGVSVEQIQQIVAAGNARAQSLGTYDPNAPNYGTDSNITTSGKSYDQIYAEVMTQVDKWSWAGAGLERVFNIGSTIIVAHA